MSGGDPELLGRWRELLDDEPDPSGGRVVVLATDSSPPAVSLLTTSSVRLDGDRVTVAIQATSTAARRPSSSFTLLTDDGGGGQRLEVTEVQQRAAGHVVLLDGVVSRCVPMAESPWRLELRFVPECGDPAPLLRSWQALRRWLRGGAVGPPP